MEEDEDRAQKPESEQKVSAPERWKKTPVAQMYDFLKFSFLYFGMANGSMFEWSSRHLRLLKMH